MGRHTGQLAAGPVGQGSGLRVGALQPVVLAVCQNLSRFRSLLQGIAVSFRKLLNDAVLRGECVQEWQCGLTIFTQCIWIDWDHL